MKLFSTEGRLNRAPFILYPMGFGIVLTVLLVVWLVMIMPESGNFDDVDWGSGLALIGVLFFSVIWFLWTIAYVTMCIRRLHDLDKDGLFVIAAFVPTVNFVFYLYLAIVKGTNGPNKYGEDPLLK
ncbi:MAG: DUF805 domain-containing protein [Selenomonadaceae bacterium]|nr:DUF805 domain-containing protein [Selenomonadaceae bacterium]